jgi:hypothetical protein
MSNPLQGTTSWHITPNSRADSFARFCITLAGRKITACQKTTSRRCEHSMNTGTPDPLIRFRENKRVTLKKHSTSIPRVDPRAALLVVLPFRCANCDSPVGDGSLFCTDLSRDKAKFVRYYRERIADCTLRRRDIQEAIQIKRGHILSGGYNARKRLVPDAVRQNVIQRDRGKCRSCGKTGSEIDHVNGDESIMENLQLLCADCHRQKTMRNFEHISPETHIPSCARKVLRWMNAP